MSLFSVTWLGWMWLTVALYWLLPARARRYGLVGLTLLFLGVHDPVSACLLLAFAMITAGTARLRVLSSWTAIAAIAALIATLAYFKIGQAIDTNALLDTLAIPLGLSYYTFRCIHVIIERLKGHQPPLHPVDVITYLFFLPTLVVGPIHRIDDYRRDLARQRFDPRLISEGAERILYGYAKVAILSNWLTQQVFGDYIAGQSGVWAGYLIVVQNGLNLYFQFSGFSDVAIGFARLLGFRVMENFNWPYFQTNISAFWRSWHISLSQWCRQNINDVIVSFTRSPILGAYATMIVIGLWHEISLRFLLWGLYHATGILIWQKTQTLGARIEAVIPAQFSGLIHVAKVLLTTHFVWLGFIALQPETSAEAFDMLRALWPG